MNNDNPIKLINENGAAKEYGRIPDLWHVAMMVSEGKDFGALMTDEDAEKLSEAILEVWHMAHDLKSCIEGQGKARIVDPGVIPAWLCEVESDSDNGGE